MKKSRRAIRITAFVKPFAAYTILGCLFDINEKNNTEYIG